MNECPKSKTPLTLTENGKTHWTSAALAGDPLTSPQGVSYFAKSSLSAVQLQSVIACSIESQIPACPWRLMQSIT